MKEGDSSRSIDDIFASVSRLGRQAGATEAATGQPSPVPPDDTAASTSSNPPLDAGTADAGVILEKSLRTAVDDRLSERPQGASAETRKEEPEPSSSVKGQRREDGQGAVPAQRLYLADDQAPLTGEVDEDDWSADQAQEQAHERARAEQPAHFDELTEEERRATEQAAAQVALLARHRAEADERAHQAEEERRAAEQAAPLARERALTKKRARLAAAAAEERRAAERAEAKAALAHERALVEASARLAAEVEQDRLATEQAAALAAAEAEEQARAAEDAKLVESAEQKRLAEEEARLAEAAEQERRAAEQLPALAATEERERAQAEEHARVVAVAAEEERQAAAREVTADSSQEQSNASSQTGAPLMDAVSSRIEATRSQAETPGARPGRSRAAPTVVIAAALVVAAGAVAFMNHGSGDVAPASGAASSGGAYPGAASSGTVSGRSEQMLRSLATVSSTIPADPTAGPVGSPAASVVAPRPSEIIRMVVGPSDSTAQWVARQLARGPSNVPASSPDLLPHDSWLASVQALALQPRMTVLRYDVLQAAREAPRSARVPNLEVIAPIGTEPLFFVVRRDSPLRFIHELQGRAINVGAADGARALTARNAYHLLFDGWPSVSAATALDEGAALDRLAADRSLDAVAVLGASPLSTLARRAPLAAHGLKLLALDDNGPAGQRLLATFLSIPVSDPALNGKQRMTTPGILSFLVTARGSPDDHARHDDFVRAAAGSLCVNWTAIGQSRAGLAISPGLQADVGWPYAAAAQQALARCSDRSDTAAANPVSPQTVSR